MPERHPMHSICRHFDVVLVHILVEAPDTGVGGLRGTKIATGLLSRSVSMNGKRRIRLLCQHAEFPVLFLLSFLVNLSQPVRRYSREDLCYGCV